MKEEEQCFQEQLFLQQHFHQQMHQQNSEISHILPWTLPQGHTFNPVHFPSNPPHDHDPFLLQPPPSSPYGNLFNRRPHFGYDVSPSTAHLGLISDTVLGRVVQPGLAHFGLQSELMGKMSAQEMMDAKALAASKSHSEAERRRRERINNHLAKLRSMLPSTTKTDKASLLAEVIQHVKELKRQTTIIAESNPIPTEIDELTLDESDNHEDGKFIIKASLCCEDRSDLLPELIKTLKALRLRTLKAEITTLGGRVKNVLFITGEDDEDSNGGDQEHEKYSLGLVQEALKAVMERANGDDSSSSSVSVKRQRTNMNMYH